jgi:aminoglycoside phosphotransferase (APT) family kinase protein
MKIETMMHDQPLLDDGSDEPAPVRAGEELPLAALELHLRRHLPLRDAPLQVLQFPHGHSNLTYLVRSGADEWVLRRPPFGNQVKSAHDMGREFRILSRLCDLYPPAPRPVYFCEDPSILGAPFYLMQRRRGLIVRKQMPPGLAHDAARLRRMSEVLIDNLADLHALDARRPELAELGKPEGYAGRQVHGWTRRYRDAETDRIEAVDVLADWLTQHVPAGHDACVVHNDYKFDNVVFDPRDPSRIVAVLDWEMATLGDPLMDLGTTLGYWVQASDLEEQRATAMGPTMSGGCLTRLEIVQCYAARTGRDTGDIVFYYAFGLFKIAVIIQQIYARFARGYTADPRFAGLSTSVAALGRQGVRVIERGTI